MRTFFLFIFVTLIAQAELHAQIIPALGCNDKAIRLQAEQIKQDFKTQGLEMYKDAMIDMESKQPTPIAVQLTKGVLYQMIYIGSKDANRMSFELYDGSDKKIEDRVLKTPGITNQLIYSFIPEKTDLYLVILYQNKGTQNICGSFSIMQPSSKPKQQYNLPTNKQPQKPINNPRYNPKGSTK